MGISLRTHKLLWGRSGNQCAICKTELVVDSGNPNDDPSIVGEEAHIVARSESSTRGSCGGLSAEGRDKYSNLILLCRTHHKQIDDQPSVYTAARLREIKAKHEREVKSRHTPSDNKQQEIDLIYSGYIDEWNRLADLDNWRNLSGNVTSPDGPSVPKAWHEAQRQFLVWVIGRVWPECHPALRNALANYKAVVQDFLNTFDRHVESERDRGDYFHTEKFYKIREWNPELYTRLLKEFNDHVDLLCDLFFELSRAANYVCDQVRGCLFPGYRIHEGVLLVERYNVGLGFKTEYIRAEYRGRERTKTPYPGLRRFKKVRYTRDYAIDPNPSEPPWRKPKEDA